MDFDAIWLQSSVYMLMMIIASFLRYTGWVEDNTINLIDNIECKYRG